MKSLNRYLPQDISNIILDYVYKPDMKKLNNEYTDTFDYNDEDAQLVSTKYGIYNFRTSRSEHDHVFNSRNIVVDFLPYNYWYSSGCNRSDGYKIKNE